MLQQTYILIMILSAVSTLFLSGYAVFHIKKNGTYSYALLMLAVSFYSLGYAYELTCTVMEEFQRALKIQYLGIPLISASWLIFASEYTGTGKQKYYPLLFVIPLITVLLVYTSNSHKLYYTGLNIDYSHSFPTLVVSRGPWYIFHTLYSYAMIIWGNLIFLIQIRRTKGSLRMQAIVVFSASLLPLIGSILYMSGHAPMGLDVTPLFLSALGPIYLFVMSRYGLFSLMPIALRTIFEEMENPVFVLDRDRRIINYNKAALRFIGASHEQVIGKEAISFFDSYPALKDEIMNETYETKEIDRKKSGEESFYRADFSPLKTQENRFTKEKDLGVVLTLQNITSEKKLILSLNKLAATDELTGISNRRNFTSLAELELGKAVRYERNISLIILDIDHFKKVNDQFGHQAGDQVLVEVVNSIKSNLRPFDLFGRFGGEEFIILLPETDNEAAVLAAERIRSTIEKLVVSYEKESISVTVSLGITSVGDFQRKECSFDLCVQQADKAMYEAKEKGRNRVCRYITPTPVACK